MTNEELIKFGKEQLEIFGDSQMSEFIRLAIKALEERPNGKWIPVTERLPEEDEEYLATIQDGYKRYIGVAWYVGRGEWHYCGETMKVIAWQRLPSIYGNER